MDSRTRQLIVTPRYTPKKNLNTVQNDIAINIVNEIVKLALNPTIDIQSTKISDTLISGVLNNIFGK